ncbi:MAG: hypothetical protein TREMPRED_005467 [Tremellales sp. Tagirdzhanova-0007]|nr:MAG: hypothetical protein TREMPRED_005467 [Tremellales sp. Tagirdzhanova-0007]
MFCKLITVRPRPRITHTCDQLSASLEGSSVVLGGWLFSKRRASATVHFFTIRDSTSLLQLVSRDAAVSGRLMGVPLESVILVEGSVTKRKQKAKISSAAEDEIEVEVRSAKLLNPAEAILPFYPNRVELANEDLRAQYRQLDLRRTELADNLQLRSRVAHIIRCHLHDQGVSRFSHSHATSPKNPLGFTEVETPILVNSSPEGAREFLVPTRLSSSTSSPSFYALQQSPQQSKQLLIASGAVAKYFQLARCFRDEDGRKDRQPEFTQVDIEMAFVDGAPAAVSGGDTDSKNWAIGGGQAKDLVEGLVRRIWREVKSVELDASFRVMQYEVAMEVYGSDKPDTRFEMYTLPIGYYPALSDADLDTILGNESEYTVEWMITPAAEVDGLEPAVLLHNNPLVHHIRISEANVHSWPQDSPLTRPLKLQLDQSRPGGASPGDIIWLAQRKKIPEGGWTQLGRLRVRIMDTLVAQGSSVLSPSPFDAAEQDFPLFTRADEDKAFLSNGRWASTHHPFTAPMWEDLEDLKRGRVDAVRGQHYDLVLNGQEIGGGSVRIHDARLQDYVMRSILQLDEDEIGRFSHLFHALKFGAPPHGGIALGFDRLVAILCGAKSIRDVIAFPKSTTGADPVFKSPSPAQDEVLRRYGLQPFRETTVPVSKQ